VREQGRASRHSSPIRLTPGQPGAQLFDPALREDLENFKTETTASKNETPGSGKNNCFGRA
jgi:hypothetical protein